ncbi:MAG: DUF2163 domain-containing protein [Alteripontixanthobacter sp.]
MSAATHRVFFASELEGVATFWRIHRRDGVTLGFTSHDRDLWFDGVLHRAAPGILPSAIRRTADLSDDSAEMQGALSHGSIASGDLAAGRFDAARVEIGAVDWENLERTVLYNGSIGTVAEESETFLADLLSAKAALQADPIPRTSPTCRARFCDAACGLSPVPFDSEAAATAIDHSANAVQFAHDQPARFAAGSLRWIDGPQAGLRFDILSADAAGLVLDPVLDPALVPGMRAELREGCDHTFATCRDRFGNGVNFQGEPYLPGNDLLTRRPGAQ